MSRYQVTFAYADRLSGSRRFEVAVDLRRDFDHVALLVATIPEDEIGGRGGRVHVDRTRSVARYVDAIAEWAKGQISAGQLNLLPGDDRRVIVPGSELDVRAVHDEHPVLTDGDEVLLFEW